MIRITILGVLVKNIGYRTRPDLDNSYFKDLLEVSGHKGI